MAIDAQFLCTDAKPIILSPATLRSGIQVYWREDTGATGECRLLLECAFENGNVPRLTDNFRLYPLFKV